MHVAGPFPTSEMIFAFGCIFMLFLSAVFFWASNRAAPHQTQKQSDLLDDLLRRAVSAGFKPFLLSQNWDLSIIKRLQKRIFHRRRIFVISHPNDIAKVLTARPEYFPKDALLYDCIIANILLGHHGLLTRKYSAEYTSVKKAIVAAFHRSRLIGSPSSESAAVKCWRHAALLVSRWGRFAQTPDCVFTVTPLRDISECLLGFLCEFAAFPVVSVNLCDIAQAFRRLTKYTCEVYHEAVVNSRNMTCCTSRFPPDIEAAREVVNNFAEAIATTSAYHNSHKNSPESDSLLQLIATSAAYDKDHHAAFVDHVKTFLFAGYDTTSNAVLWALKLLSESATVQDGLAQQVAAVMSNAATADDVVSNLRSEVPLLRAVVLETLRLYPPAPLLYRTVGIAGSNLAPLSRSTAEKPTAGDVLILDIHAAHRFEVSHNPRTEHFTPFRWLNEPLNAERMTNLFPFSLGTRMCIGKDLALVEMDVFLAVLVSNFVFSPVKLTRSENSGFGASNFSLTLSPEEGFRLKIRKRC